MNSHIKLNLSQKEKKNSKFGKNTAIMMKNTCKF